MESDHKNPENIFQKKQPKNSLWDKIFMDLTLIIHSIENVVEFDSSHSQLLQYKHLLHSIIPFLLSESNHPLLDYLSKQKKKKKSIQINSFHFFMFSKLQNFLKHHKALHLENLLQFWKYLLWHLNKSLRIIIPLRHCILPGTFWIKSHFSLEKTRVPSISEIK